jgi:6-phosphogluconolactonase
MSERVIQTFADIDEVSRAAAAEFVRCAGEAIAARSRFTVALSGGSTPHHQFQLLAAEPYRDQVDWPGVQVFWGDERSVPPDHKDSNYRMAKEALLTKVPLTASNVHRLKAERTDRDNAAREYQETIARVFGVPADGEPPAFDLVLLGMGPDGHTASLFPHTTALGETTRWVVVNYVAKFSTDRVTLTYPILNRAREVLFLVTGADKAEPLQEVLEGPPDPLRLPSQKIRPVSGKLVWFLDRLAAAKLTQSAPGAGG